MAPLDCDKRCEPPVQPPRMRVRARITFFCTCRCASVETTAPVHKKKLLTYLRLADKRLGLLVNFGTALIRDGIERVVNGLEE